MAQGANELPLHPRAHLLPCCHRNMNQCSRVRAKPQHNSYLFIPACLQDTPAQQLVLQHWEWNQLSLIKQMNRRQPVYLVNPTPNLYFVYVCIYIYYIDDIACNEKQTPQKFKIHHQPDFKIQIPLSNFVLKIHDSNCGMKISDWSLKVTCFDQLNKWLIQNVLFCCK